MRVLLCVPAYKPALDYGGPVSKVALLAKGLVECGASPSILTSDFGFSWTHTTPGTRTVDGIPVTYCRRLIARRHLSVPHPSLIQALSKLEVDVVHAFGLRDGLVTAVSLWAIRQGLPLVVEPMGMTPARVRSFRMKGIFDRAIGDRITGAARLSVATSELEAGHLREAGFPNVQVRMNPVDIAVGSATRRRSARYDICYVGRLHRLKRITDILETVSRKATLTALIAGPDEDGSGVELRAEIRERGLEDRVEIRGWVDEHERSRILAESRCFVLPSLTENFGNAAAEALAGGVPVVVTKECGIASLVRDAGAGAVVDIGPDGVAGGVVEVLKRPQDEWSAACEAAVAALSPSAIALRQVQLYAGLVRADS